MVQEDIARVEGGYTSDEGLRSMTNLQVIGNRSSRIHVISWKLDFGKRVSIDLRMRNQLCIRDPDRVLHYKK
jgi:hypothetical protein